MSTPTICSANLTHVDEHGAANMVDVSGKQVTRREATAIGAISMSAETLLKVQQNKMAKGDVLSTARIAGIQASKSCANLIPLCHPLMLSKVSIDFDIDEQNNEIRVLCHCKLDGVTGVEMEALTGVSVALLTLFDMCKAADPSMIIYAVRVLEKSGGKSGVWRRENDSN